MKVDEGQPLLPKDGSSPLAQYPADAVQSKKASYAFFFLIGVVLFGGTLKGLDGNFSQSSLSTNDRHREDSKEASRIENQPDIDDYPGADDGFDFTSHESHAGESKEIGIGSEAPLGDVTESMSGEMYIHYVNRTTSPMARCLDGTNPAFWLRKSNASGARANKWMVHLKGGGWCVTDDECAGWVESHYQSGTGPGANLPNNFTGVGILSVDPEVNPNFFDWNVAYVWYCDGGSYSGDRATQQYNNQTVFFRGKHILDGVMRTLAHDHGMHAANEVVVSGTSAGGLGVITRCDSLTNLVENLGMAASLSCVVDAGFFINSTDFDGHVGTWTGYWETLVSTHQIMASLNADCKAAQPFQQTWRCLLPQYQLLHISTRIFLIQSVIDFWQLKKNFFSKAISSGAEAGHDCLYHPTRMCTFATFAGIQSFRQQLLGHLEDVAAANSNVSFFADCCFNHAQTDKNKPFSHPVVENSTMSMALERWLTNEQSRVLDKEPWPHQGQKCDWGPEWLQYMNNASELVISNEYYVQHFLSQDGDHR